MAQKRMFDKSIMETDSFMDMPMPTKALYFLLGMEADDEGFTSPKRVMRIYGGNDDDLKLLMAKGFVINFKSGVIVITNWYENNYLDRNRIKETKYQAEKAMLGLSNNRYSLISKENKPLLNNGLTDVKRPFNQYSIEESSIEENRIEEKSTPARTSKNSLIPCTEEELWEISNYHTVGIDEVKKTHDIILGKIETKEFKYKTVYQTLRSWVGLDIKRGYSKPVTKQSVSVRPKTAEELAWVKMRSGGE